MSSTKRYWKDLAELHQDPEALAGRENEFPTDLPIDQVLGDPKFNGATTGRRDFLKFLGFSVSAATLAACETPVVKSIPYVNKPEEITPGVATWYASTYYDGDDYASILVKTREGRPIHIMGNPRHGLNNDAKAGKGAINARINSSVLALYDSERVKGPVMRHEGGFMPHSWEEADKAIMGKLDELSKAGKRIVVLTGTVISPATRQAIDKLKNRFGGSTVEQEDGLEVSMGGRVDHVQYDTISYAGLTRANKACFGKAVMPSYDLTKADVLVSFGADFLSTWGNTTEHTWQYAQRRKPEGGHMNRHWQFEARMSLTGANADVRVPTLPSALPKAIIALHDHLAKKAGASTVGGASAEMSEATAKVADELWAARGKSLVLAGANDEGVQTLVNHINWMLGNYGQSIDMAGHSWMKQGDDAAMDRLVQDLNAGKVGAILLHGVNPVYSLPDGASFAAGLAKADLSVSFSGHADETASHCAWICPDNHYLESWNDLMPRVGHYALAQPVISPLFNTRQWQDSLLAWSGADMGYHQLIKSTWEAAMTNYGSMTSFENAWNKAVHDGVFHAYDAEAVELTFTGDLSGAAKQAALMPGQGTFEVELYTSPALGNGLHANNPWLQEMPDPLTKVTWDNYVCMAPSDMEQLGLQTYLGQESPASLVTLSVGDRTLELPAVPLPGQKPGSVSVALGYGRGANGERVGRAACLSDDDGNPVPVGRNAYPMTRMSGSAVSYVTAGELTATGGTYPIGITQTHLTDMDRHSVVKEVDLKTFLTADKEVYNHPHELAVHEDVNGDGVVDARDKKSVLEFDLWNAHAVEGVGHRWGMSIDLNSCIGCGACITACNSENNIPVVGKDEVRRSREMHWMRIDRYYSSDMTKERAQEEGLGKIGMYLDMEVPSEKPSVVFMPVMCQHCNHAPCETVCPVAATTHSNEGLNQMTYNRCIGTRYCANNCPYKVRRFNWFNYVTEKFGEVNPAWDEVGRMVLNPDVTVRSRGVIEKCSMCVQRIQAGKIAAKKDGSPVKDGDIQTACSSGCPTSAITFGDLNDEGSLVRQLATSDRAYHMLEEVGVQPNVNYLVKVRNTEEAAHGHHA
ncbi:MAG: TAT-variant-translocated molybdopterin oxidoreductase [Flavobacteriales bacterium]|nr:TAT-variant-translocated molybdopterin oxidoreductase [Flavobacteriales bacterium]MCB9200649.1 TAT-variant-translocated molybdopterin oxidoreductase [Flavobacteriales bacterium]